GHRKPRCARPDTYAFGSRQRQIAARPVLHDFGIFFSSDRHTGCSGLRRRHETAANRPTLGQVVSMSDAATLQALRIYLLAIIALVLCGLELELLSQIRNPRP